MKFPRCLSVRDCVNVCVPHVDFWFSQSNFTEVGVKFIPLDNTNKAVLVELWSVHAVPCVGRREYTSSFYIVTNLG
jgi:hypothetical protein